MSDTPRQLLPKDVLFALLPASFEPWGSVYRAFPPSAESIARIHAELGIVVPQLFIDVALACSSYGGWFNSIGDNYAHHMHILTVNAAWRAEGLPSRYVLFNHGHDGDCDAWDTEGEPTNDELPIVYFHFDPERNLELRRLHVSARSFADYIDDFVRSHAPSCPVQHLRRAAKRLLEGHGER